MKIAVLTSGGVDSSVALRLLCDQGHDVTAFYLKIWLEEDLAHLGSCPWEEDLAYVERLCADLGVPLRVMSLQKEYWRRVVSYTLDQVKCGRTPNPDMLCNQRIKFGAFYDKIDPCFEKVATGHYARVEQGESGYHLKMTGDPIKDQTYFLAHLSQAQLARAMFPIGHMTKEQVRALAASYNLPNKDRKDSQGICFLGQIKFRDFIKHHLGVQYGDIISFESGEKLGEHEGFWYYTIGQRKGIGLSGGPWYVVRKDCQRNVVYVSRDYYAPDKQRNVFDVTDFNWISGEPQGKSHMQVKVRHGAHSYNADIVYSGDRARVSIDGSDQGISPGQFAVFYDKDLCLGCGRID